MTVRRKTAFTSTELIKKSVEAIKGATFYGCDAKHKPYSAPKHAVCFKLPGWYHTIGIDTETGEMTYDSDNRGQKQQDALKDFMQGYTKAAAEQAYAGKKMSQTTLPNGDIKIKVQLGDYDVGGAGSGDPAAGGYGVAGPAGA
jgi:hypothetical protein